MQGIQRIQNDRRATRAGERGRDFFTDVPGFSNPQNDDFVAALDGSLDEINGRHKLTVQARSCGFHLGKLDLKNTTRQLQIIHAGNHAKPRPAMQGRRLKGVEFVQPIEHDLRPGFKGIPPRQQLRARRKA